MTKPSEEKPYIEVIKISLIRKYNPKYGDDRICECGHTYYRHWDWMDALMGDDPFCSCKYCGCTNFVEKKG